MLILFCFNCSHEICILHPFVHLLYNKTIADYLVIEYDVIFTGKYLSPRSILVFSSGYHIIFNDSVVKNCIILGF